MMDSGTLGLSDKMRGVDIRGIMIGKLALMIDARIFSGSNFATSGIFTLSLSSIPMHQ
jgi:hypothetical protein